MRITTLAIGDSEFEPFDLERFGGSGGGALGLGLGRVISFGGCGSGDRGLWGRGMGSGEGAAERLKRGSRGSRSVLWGFDIVGGGIGWDEGWLGGGVGDIIGSKWVAIAGQ